MKVAWILLISLFIVFMLDDSDAWRRFRFRVRVRRIFRKVTPRIRFRTRRFFRKIGSIIKSGVKKVAKVVVKATPGLFVAKKLLDKYKQYKTRKFMKTHAAAEVCQRADLCGGSFKNGRYRWHCANICDVMKDDQVICQIKKCITLVPLNL